MKRLLTIAAAVAAIAVAPSAAEAQSATTAISLVHGIPGTTVDLVVDGTVVLDAFTPGSIVDITSFAGRTLNDVEVVVDGSGDPLIGPVAALEVPATGNWSIVAHLDADGDATLSSFQNNTADTSNDQARLTVRHTAEVPAVDLVVGDQRPITNLANGGSAELELPPGALTGASVALAGGGTTVLEITGVTLAANTNTIVFVVGSETDGTLAGVVQVVALPASTPTTTTTTTVAGATTTTVAGTTTTTAPTPSAVNTGSPVDGSSSMTTLLVIALGGLVLAGGSYLVRRRV